MKLLFFDWRIGSHSFSPTSEQILVQYLNHRGQEVGDTRIRLNQYAPHKDFKRLFTNRKVAWPYRLFFGGLTLLVEAVLPGRLFAVTPFFSDYYNPWTDTVHLYSDHPAIGLHELGHAYDINQQPFKGTYSLFRTYPIVTLHQEWQATDEAISYLTEVGDRRNELRAYKILYPAFGSYVGGYFIPLGGIPGILIGHIPGRLKARTRARFYHQLDAQTQQSQQIPTIQTPAVTSP